VRPGDEISGRAPFPTTRWSLIVSARSDQVQERQRALDVLIAAYWKPVYKHIRLKWKKDFEDARDLTQDFFSRVLERDFFSSFDPLRARLRTFLRICVDRFVSNENQAAQRQKRGGEFDFVALDFEAAEGELRGADVSPSQNPDELFAQEWIRSLFELSLEQLRRECEQAGKTIHFQLLEMYDIEDGGKTSTYEDVAKKYGLKASEVTNYLAYARREFRRIVLEQLRLSTASEEEFRKEAQTLLGVRTT
jgi:RNA polymerase sigma factor (sigma-70 family)